MNAKTLLSGFLISVALGCCLPLFALDAPTLERTRAAILLHQSRLNQSASVNPVPTSKITDIGDISVMTGDKFTMFQAAPFDLQNASILFTPNGTGGYDVNLSPHTGTITSGNIRVRKREWITFPAGFQFPFYGKKYIRVNANPERGLTFEETDNGPGPELFSYLAGSPTITALIKKGGVDIDLTVNHSTSVFTATWRVIDYYVTANFIAQINLYPNGKIEMIFGGDSPDPLDPFQRGLVGISPGGIGIRDLALVDYSQLTAMKIGGRKAIFQCFSNSESPDFTAILQEFHKKHPQGFDFVVIFTDQPYGELPHEGLYSVQNSVQGIGRSPSFDKSSLFRSPRLKGFINMGDLANYPADSHERFKFTYNTLGLLANLHGQQWTPYVDAYIGAKNFILQLRGYGPLGPTWNFYLHTNGSVMGGNSIRDNGNGTFTTLGATTGYSQLDQYLMGLIPSSEVAPFFLVRNTGGKLNVPPMEGVTFAGTKANLTIDDVLKSAGGARIPSSASSPKQFREAFLFFVSPGNEAGKGQITKIDRIRKAWETFFATATSHHGSIDTSLTQ